MKSKKVVKKKKSTAGRASVHEEVMFLCPSWVKNGLACIFDSRREKGCKCGESACRVWTKRRNDVQIRRMAESIGRTLNIAVRNNKRLEELCKT